MKLRVRLRNGYEVEGPPEQWLAALIATLPEATREAVAARVDKRLVTYSTPGNYVLRAEGGVYGLKGNGR